MKEDDIIELIKKGVKVKNPEILVGPGDDAAVIASHKKFYILFTTDCVVEDVHFSRKEATLFQIARKAIAVNLSDIAAMGGVPLYALVSAGLPEGVSRKDILEILRGLRCMAESFKFDIVGGNLTRSDKLFIDVSLAGKVEKRYLKLRSGARPADLIFVTGKLGGSRLGKHLEFTPRIREAREIIKKVPVSAMMDISDGLSTDLIRLAKASRAGFRIYLEKIPVSEDAVKISKSKGDVIHHALNDGEDYELLFTVPEKYRKRVPSKINSVPLTCIGEITEERKYRGISSDGKEIFIKPSGYSHF